MTVNRRLGAHPSRPARPARGALDNKIRSSIVEGVSVLLSMFDLPAVARVFCPPAPEARRLRGTAEPRPADNEGHELPALAPAALSGDLPPLDALIEGGKRRGA